MKLNNVASICARVKCAHIGHVVDRDGVLTQFVGDGGAMYRIDGLPALDKDTLLTIFSVLPKKKEEWQVIEGAMPEEINAEDVDIREIELEPGRIRITSGGMLLIPMFGGGGVVFMNSAYLKPIHDDAGVQKFFLRRSEYSEPYIVVKAGFLLQAIIRPEEVINKAFTDSISALAYQCRRMLDQKDRVGESRTEDLPLLKEDENAE